MKIYIVFFDEGQIAHIWFTKEQAIAAAMKDDKEGYECGNMWIVEQHVSGDLLR